MKAVLLAGGFGTRISEESQYRPKPMIEIGGMPILWHIMKHYSHYGFQDFIICCGYKQHVIKEFFADKTVSYVKKDRELTRTNYEVVFQDGTEVEFNGKGQWHSIDCKRAAVPAALIPAAISEYVRQGFPGQDIVKIDKETYGHEIKFASGLELKFSKNGKLVNVDD